MTRHSTFALFDGAKKQKRTLTRLGEVVLGDRHIGSMRMVAGERGEAHGRPVGVGA